jgi:hypothetical protein
MNIGHPHTYVRHMSEERSSVGGAGDYQCASIKCHQRAMPLDQAERVDGLEIAAFDR